MNLSNFLCSTSLPRRFRRPFPRERGTPPVQEILPRRARRAEASDSEARDPCGTLADTGFARPRRGPIRRVVPRRSCAVRGAGGPRRGVALEHRAHPTV